MKARLRLMRKAEDERFRSPFCLRKVRIRPTVLALIKRLWSRYDNGSDLVLAKGWTVAPDGKDELLVRFAPLPFVLPMPGF